MRHHTVAGSHLLAAGEHAASSVVQHIAAGIAGFVAARRRAAEARQLRDTLADMTDASLLDIGIAEDEIYRIRARDDFTPRAWIDPRSR